MWDEIEIPGPEAEEVARFAVEQYNQKQNAQIKFVRVVGKPKARLEGGTEYHVTLEVDRAGKMLRCQAEALYKPSNLKMRKQLMKFQQHGRIVDSDHLSTYELAPAEHAH